MELGDVEFFLHRVDVPLAAAERDSRDAVSGEPVGVEAAVGDGQIDIAAFGTHGFGGGQYNCMFRPIRDRDLYRNAKFDRYLYRQRRTGSDHTA